MNCSIFCLDWPGSFKQLDFQAQCSPFFAGFMPAEFPLPFDRLFDLIIGLWNRLITYQNDQMVVCSIKWFVANMSTVFLNLELLSVAFDQICPGLAH